MPPYVGPRTTSYLGFHLRIRPRKCSITSSMEIRLSARQVRHIELPHCELDGRLRIRSFGGSVFSHAHDLYSFNQDSDYKFVTSQVWHHFVVHPPQSTTLFSSFISSSLPSTLSFAFALPFSVVLWDPFLFFQQVLGLPRFPPRVPDLRRGYLYKARQGEDCWARITFL